MKLKFLSHFKPLFGKYRYKVCLSGRGSGKSVHIAIALLWYASRAKVKILCVREYMNSIAESSKAQIEEMIEKSGTRDHWTITNTEIIHKKTQSRFIFKGVAHNVSSIKSIPDIDILWCEEAETMSRESIDILIPTIRKANSQLWFSGNPKDRTQAISQMFIENEPPPNTVLICNDYRDNPFCSEELKSEAEHLKTTSPEMYNHIWLGEYLDTANLILVRNCILGQAPERKTDRVVVGVDIARDGGDRSVICVRKGANIAWMKSYPTMDLDHLVAELQSVIFKYKPERINVDSTGHGAWVPDALKAYDIQVSSINFASNAKNEKKYSKMRSEMYGLAAEYFNKGGRIGTNHTELRKELEASYYTLDSKNRIQVIPKSEIKRMIGVSPDLADAFCLSLICDGDMLYRNPVTEEIDKHNLNKQFIESGGWGG